MSKITYEEVYQRFIKANCELLDKEYINSKTLMKYKCSCGNIAYINLNNFTSGGRCKNCKATKEANDRRKSYEEVYNYFLSRNCVLLETEYFNNRQKLQYKCSCGNVAYISFNDFQQGRLCRKCRSKRISEKTRYSIDEVKNFFEEFGYTLLSKQYINNSQSLDYICSEGHYGSIKLTNFLSGKRCKQCFLNNHKGEKHHNYNSLLTNEQRENNRDFVEYVYWRKSVFNRDSYTCQVCGEKKRVNAHHLDGYNWCLEKRVDINNGITLCKTCHEDFHSIYGRGNNTHKQFKEWLELKNKKEIECEE